MILHRRAEQNHDHDIFRITIPKYTDVHQGQQASDKQIKDRLASVETMFASLASMRAERGMRAYFYGRRDHFALEIVSDGNEISFYAALPKPVTEFFIQQVHSVYPQAHFEPVSDYNIFQAHASILGGYITFKRAYLLPIKTYKTLDTDPLEAITMALSKVPEHNGAAVQFIVRSSNRSWRNQGRRLVKNVVRGEGTNENLRRIQAPGNPYGWVFKALMSIFSLIASTLMPSKKAPTEQQKPMLTQHDQEIIKVIDEKMNKAGFDVSIRVIASSPDRHRAEMNLRNIMGAFGQFNSYEYGNAFQPSFVGTSESTIRKFIYRVREPRANIILNSEEMVGLFHLPEQIQTPNIRWLRARKVPPPQDIPNEGIILGRSPYRGEVQDVHIKDKDRRRHVYIIGQTGVGKSVLMEQMAIQDIQRGKGICIIDPHGDSIEAVLRNVPKERSEDVIIFDPADVERPIGINMLEYTTPEQKTFVINEMINIFDKLYDLRTTGGPMFEQYMRNSMLLIMEDPTSGSTILEIPKVLADAKFRKYKLSRTKNPVVKDFWEKEAEKAGGEASLANMVPYITSKLTQFVANDTMRPIISQQNSAFNFRDIMDKQQILLINLSKGKIGDMNSMLLGMVIVGKILMAALSRVDVDEDKRTDFYLYIDEFQNFITDSIAIILSEARKYKLNLTIAHQYIGQLVKNNNTHIRDAVFGNVGSIVSFRVGVEDAELIAKQFTPVVDTYDLMNLDKFNAYIRLLVDNQNLPAFSFNPIAPQRGDSQRAESIRQLSRMKYGRSREVIEREIIERTKIAYPVDHPLPPLA